MPWGATAQNWLPREGQWWGITGCRSPHIQEDEALRSKHLTYHHMASGLAQPSSGASAGGRSPTTRWHLPHGEHPRCHKGLQNSDLEPHFCLAEVTQQEKWTRELTAWRAMVGEHDRMMQSWRKVWVRGSRAAAPLKGLLGAHSASGWVLTAD